MRTALKLMLGALFLTWTPGVAYAQELAPRAYVIGPIHANAVILSYSMNSGGLLFNDAIPITNATATLHVPVFTFYHSLSFFGRSANVTASLPYGVGNFHGNFIDQETQLHRSGLLDSVYRFSVNLRGGPAMSVKDFQSWRQKTIVGVSLKVVAPTGQYDSTKLINNGSNRWGFKPELGYSRRLGHWVLDGSGGAWFFTTNHDFWSHNAFFPGTRAQSQAPIGAFEAHLSYDVKPRLWVSLDANTWFNGTITLSGVQNALTKQLSSLIGVSASVPLNKHQSLKVGYNATDYVQYGGSFHNISVAWQYSWLGRPN